jgi:DNA (cytosine-5)-methyltransferase 3A
MNILSLFDGISCGQVALERAGIPIKSYYASEIDSKAIDITQRHFPNTIQLGDVTKIRAKDLPRIDILLAGSPCTGFSKSGKRLNFEDPQSKLYLDFVRLWKTTKPRYFLLENVVMLKEFQEKINTDLGVTPIKINSSLVSPQSRTRLYWTNIPNVSTPRDMKLFLGHVIERIPKGRLVPPVNRNISNQAIRDQIRRCLGRSKHLDTFTWRWDVAGRILVMYADGRKIQRIGRIAMMDTKTEIVTTMTVPHMMDRDFHLRKLTPEECEALQTLPRGYTEGVSISSRYRCIGNGWTVDVISHILSKIPRD